MVDPHADSRALQTRVVLRGGSPALTIDGRPDAATAFFPSSFQGCAEEIRGLVGAGVRILTGAVSVTRAMRPEGVYGWEEFVGRMRNMLDAAPGILVLPRLMVDYDGLCPELADYL